jgi:hypothetical protein
MATTATRPSIAARRFGYLVAVGINAAMLWFINIWPGWWVLPFLTRDVELVIGWMNVSILVGIGANLVYAVNDPPWLRAVGEIVTAAVGLVVLRRVWDVFPFQVPDRPFDWALMIRVVLVVAIIGSVVAIVVQLVRLVRLLSTSANSEEGEHEGAPR